MKRDILIPMIGSMPNGSQASRVRMNFKADAAMHAGHFLLLMAILTSSLEAQIAHGLEAREKGILDKIEQAPPRRREGQTEPAFSSTKPSWPARDAEAQQIVGEARKPRRLPRKRSSGRRAGLSCEREKAVADNYHGQIRLCGEIAGEERGHRDFSPGTSSAERSVPETRAIDPRLKQFPNN